MLKSISIIIFCLYAFSCCYSQTDSSKIADSLLLLKIQNEISSEGVPSGQTPPPQQRVGASANPNLSVIGDFRGLYRSFGGHNFDAVLHETEFSFQSVVDPYARADFFFLGD